MKRWIPLIILTSILAFQQAQAGVVNKAFANYLKTRGTHDTIHVVTNDLVDTAKLYHDGTKWILDGGGDSADVFVSQLKVGIASNNWGFWLRNNSGTAEWSEDSGNTWQSFASGTGDITAVTAGDGLTGGGATGAVTLNVVGGDGLAASADDIDITCDDSTIEIGSTNDNIRLKASGIDSGHVKAGSIAESDLLISNAPTDEYALTWEADAGTGGQMTWEAQAGGGGTNDSAILDMGGGTYKSSSEKAWSLKIGTGLSIAGTLTDSVGVDTGTIYSTLGTSVDLTSEVTGELPDGNVSDAISVSSSGSVDGGALTTQTVKSDHVDSTAEPFVFSSAYHVNSAQADSAYVTANTVNDTADVVRGEMTDSLDNREFLAASDTANQLRSNRDDSTNSSLYLLSGGLFMGTGSGDGIIYFKDNNPATYSFSLRWDTTNERFQFSNNLQVNGDITLSGTVDTVDIAAMAADHQTLEAAVASIFGDSLDFGFTDFGSDGDYDVDSGTQSGAGGMATKAFVRDSGGGGSDFAPIWRDSLDNARVDIDGYRGDTTDYDSMLITRRFWADSGVIGSMQNLEVQGQMLINGMVGQYNFASNLDINAAIVPTNLHGKYARWGTTDSVPDSIMYSDFQLDLEAMWDSTSACASLDSHDVYMDSANQLHPSVIYIPAGWPRSNDSIPPYKYWAAFTPLAAGLCPATENPHIFASNHPDSGWTNNIGSAAKDSIVNPLYDPSTFSIDTLFWYLRVAGGTDSHLVAYDTGRFNVDSVGEANWADTVTTNVPAYHGSDPDLFFDPEGDLWLAFRMNFPDTLVDYGGNGTNYICDGSIIYVAESSEGIDWSSTTAITHYGSDVSPSIVLDSNSTYIMFTNQREDSVMQTSEGLYKFTSSRVDTIWISGGEVNISNPPWPNYWYQPTDTLTTVAYNSATGFYERTNNPIWHPEVLQRGFDELILVSAGGITPGKAWIGLAKSDDKGENWQWADRMLMAPMAKTQNKLSWDAGTATGQKVWDSTIYRATGFWDGDKVGLYYSGYRQSGGDHWHTWYTTVYFNAEPATYSYSKIYGIPNSNHADSFKLKTEQFVNDTFFVAIDSSVFAGGSDTIGVQFDFPSPFMSDSLIFEYYTSNASFYIDSFAIYVPSDTVGHWRFAKSFLTGYDTNMVATDWHRIKVPVRINFAAGEQMRVKFVTKTTVADATIRWREMAVKGRRYETQGEYLD